MFNTFSYLFAVFLEAKTVSKYKIAVFIFRTNFCFTQEYFLKKFDQAQEYVTCRYLWFLFPLVLSLSSRKKSSNDTFFHSKCENFIILNKKIVIWWLFDDYLQAWLLESERTRAREKRNHKFCSLVPRLQFLLTE